MPQTFEDAVGTHYIVERWGDFIKSYPWQWFCHLTFDGNPSEAAANAEFKRWMNRVNRIAFGQRYYRDLSKGCTWIRGTEQQGRGALHYHAVVGGHVLPPTLGAQLWHDNAKVVAYDAQRGGAFYIPKNCVAYGMDVSNNLAASRPH